MSYRQSPFPPITPVNSDTKRTTFSSRYSKSYGLMNEISSSKQKVAYFHNHRVGRYHYGQGHPMKPARLSLTHDLVINYGLGNKILILFKIGKKMNVYSSPQATKEQCAEFHSEDYVEFLSQITPDNHNQFQSFMQHFNVGVDDCPVFDGMFEFCKYYTGASLDGARKLISEQSDISINWSGILVSWGLFGGLHHAKKMEASGFCYVNDIVLATLELLRYFPRVVYIDIDVHHGDGVQEAFYSSDRVMTVSFHRYDGIFFPATGAIDEIGVSRGKNYSINVPLQENIDDSAYAYIFKNVMNNVMETFRPSVIVLQCGTDSLACDRLGCFNISIKGHGECVRFMKSFKLPMLVLGGGGYTIRNVSRCWTYETSILTDTILPTQLPNTDYKSHFGPDYSLFPDITKTYQDNLNSRQYLDHIRTQVAEYLRHLNGAPSIQMQEIPPGINLIFESGDWEVDISEDEHPDRRRLLKREKFNNLYDEREYYSDEIDQDE